MPITEYFNAETVVADTLFFNYPPRNPHVRTHTIANSSRLAQTNAILA